jgi:hypothetical protein
VFLDRQGLLGAAPAPRIAEEATPAEPAGPRPLPRVLAAAPEIDREALELQYHQAIRENPVAAAPTAAPGDTLSGWRNDGSAAEPQALPLPIPVPYRGLQGPDLWQQYAVAVAPSGNKPMIAIVLDDVGVNRRGAQLAIGLPAPLTLSFMTYADGLPAMTAQARAAGHELMLHVPMQPRSDAMDPGPNVLREDLPRAELMQRLNWGLARFDGFVGINNHMGSRFTASPEGMALVMGELKARGLLFLDDRRQGGRVARAGCGRSLR